MDNLVAQAQTELERAGLYNKSSVYGGMLGDCVEGLIKLFAAQEHSGMSAGMTITLFGKLARFEPISPLTSFEEVKDWGVKGES